MSKTRLIPLAATLLFALILFTANASMVGFTYEQIQTQADLILLGKVTSLNQGNSSSPVGTILYQIKHVSVQKYYKGTGPENIDVRELGGSLGDGTALWVEDQPELSVGVTYLLFLKDNGGYYLVFGGPQGALSVEDGVARNFAYILSVTDSGLVPVPAEGVSIASVQNRTNPVANDPAEMVIQVESIDKAGYHTFNLSFKGISGEAEGLVEEQPVSDFILGNGRIVPFSHNFTASGTYSVGVDGTIFTQVVVRPPESQVRLSWAEYSDSLLFVDQSVTLRVGAIPSNATGEYRAIAVVTPQTEGVESFYWSYASYNHDSNWFTFHLTFKKAGNYTVTIWQGGVRQLTQSITVLPPQSSGGGAKTNPDADSGAAEAAARAAEAAARLPSHQENAGPAQIPEYPWLTPLLLVAIAIGCVFYIIRRRANIRLF